MICALTVRRLRPGSFEDFRTAFMAPLESAPPGWVQFDMVRQVDDPDTVICFGLFDGTVEELRASMDANDYEAQQASIAPFVDLIGTDGLFEVVEHRTA